MSRVTLRSVISASQMPWGERLQYRIIPEFGEIWRFFAHKADPVKD